MKSNANFSTFIIVITMISLLEGRSMRILLFIVYEIFAVNLRQISCFRIPKFLKAFISQKIPSTLPFYIS